MKMPTATDTNQQLIILLILGLFFFVSSFFSEADVLIFG